MKNDKTLMIRYIGSDEHRRYVIQRGDRRFWNGHGWTPAIADALLFASHRVAQATCGEIYDAKYKGKPTRTFRCTVEVTVIGDDAADVSRELLLTFLYNAVRIDVENSVYGDGPLEDTLVKAQLYLQTLREKKPRTGETGTSGHL